MPQKRMAARGGPGPKKALAVKPMKVEKVNKAKVKAKADAKSRSKELKNGSSLAVKAPEPDVQIERAKAALKKEKATTTRGRKASKISMDIHPGEALAALSGKWASLYKKAEQIEAKPYNMRSVFEEKTAIVHKVLGWGYILANRNDRLEVLFKDGIKYLISNYKP